MRTTYYTPAQQRSLVRIVPDLFRARQLLRDLVSRELRVRYRNAAIGFAWAVLQPLAMALILTIVFSLLINDRIADFGIEAKAHYAMILLCGLIPWQFLSSAVSGATTSLVENENLVKKVYFPREVIPISAVLNCLVNLAIGYLLLLAGHLILDGGWGIGALWWLMVFVIEFVLVIGLALLLSSLNVSYRDVRYLTEVVLLLGFYATPVFYPPSLVSNHSPLAAMLMKFNPMAALVTAYRQALFDNRCPDLTLLAIPCAMALCLLVVGSVVFRRRAPTLADAL